MGIQGVNVSAVGYVFMQEGDQSQTDTEEPQALEIFTEDNGGGPYIVIKTDRWAIDYEDIDKFAACLKNICEIPEEI
jgi:uncharacterized GH25 family protein